MLIGWLKCICAKFVSKKNVSGKISFVKIRSFRNLTCPKIWAAAAWAAAPTPVAAARRLRAVGALQPLLYDFASLKAAAAAKTTKRRHRQKSVATCVTTAVAAARAVVAAATAVEIEHGLFFVFVKNWLVSNF